MAKKYTLAPGHSITDKDGNIVGNGAEIEASQIGDAATVERYTALGVFDGLTVDDVRSSVIVTGDSTDKARETVQDDAEEAVKNAVKMERTEAAPEPKAKSRR